jgi:microcystin-dependent protein
MSQPFVGEIRMFGGNFAPAGWAFCSGQLMPISENETLFNLIGTTYGGDGQSTFALPDLQGRIPIHAGPGFVQAQTGGTEVVTLSTQQIPNHTHFPLFTTSGQQIGPGATTLLASATSAQSFLQIYTTDTSALTSFAAQTGGATGGNQPHDNMVPFLCVSFIISLFGIFPSQT